MDASGNVLEAVCVPCGKHVIEFTVSSAHEPTFVPPCFISAMSYFPFFPHFLLGSILMLVYVSPWMKSWSSGPKCLPLRCSLCDDTDPHWWWCPTLMSLLLLQHLPLPTKKAPSLKGDRIWSFWKWVQEFFAVLPVAEVIITMILLFYF